MAGTNRKKDFYASVLTEMIDEGVISTSSKILVVCGDTHDYETLISRHFENVTISNLDDRLEADGDNRFAPYAWEYQHAERLSYEDESFDFVVVHSGLHHLRCPQKGIAEMYRVAALGVLAFEPHRNLFTSLGVKLGFGQAYETAAVFYNDCKYGGVENSNVPNYVCRFTKGDIRRTIQAHSPVAGHHFRFWYATRIPDRLVKMKRKYLWACVAVAGNLLVYLGKTFPFFANNMAFYVAKPAIPGDLFPWLQVEGSAIVPKEEWLRKRYIEVAQRSTSRGNRIRDPWTDAVSP
jgi:ubiquinone/menaquinone biosynthesis C-methylase UbiE